MFSSVCMLWYHKKNISPESCSKVLRAACCETGPALRQSRHYQPTVRFLLCPSFRDGCLHSKYIICDKNNQVQIHSINPPEEPKLSEVVRNGPELPRCVNDLAELRSDSFALQHCTIGLYAPNFIPRPQPRNQANEGQVRRTHTAHARQRR